MSKKNNQTALLVSLMLRMMTLERQVESLQDTVDELLEEVGTKEADELTKNLFKKA